MKNTNNAAVARFKKWVDDTGLNKVDLADKLKYPRTALYKTLNSGRISPQLQAAIAKEYPDTDMNWLLKGSYAAPEGMVSVAKEPQSRYEKAANMSQFLERDLLKAQLRTADALERLANMMEKYLESKDK